VTLLADFRAWPPVDPITLIIRQGHFSDGDEEFLVVWSGRVLSVGREGEECVATGEPIASQLRRTGLRRHYQYGCMHVLYGGQCQAVEATFQVAGTVASLTTTTVTLTAGWNGAFGATKFNEGKLSWTNATGDTEVRKVLWVSGDTLTIAGVLRDLAVSDAVNVSLGCQRNQDDCLNLFSNIANYGGWDWIPTENPIQRRGTF
jgi:hypothetical protein